MSIKKFTTYVCDTCKRTIDIDNDPGHSQIDVVKKAKDDRYIDVSQLNKCIISLGCEGKLYPVEEKNVRNIARTIPDENIQEWSKRGEKFYSTTPVVEEQFIPLASANLELTLAIKNVTDDGTMKIVLTDNKPVSYVEYRFIIEGPLTYNLTGKDSTSKNLRFTSSDTVELRYNGVELFETIDWNRKSLLNNGVYDMIEFITPLVGSGGVRILVKEAAPSQDYFIPYTKHSGVFIDNAWANLERITIGGELYTLFSMDISSEIPINSFFSLLDDSFGGSIDIDNVYFLLSTSPWSSRDRNYTRAVKCSLLVNPLPKIQYYENENSVVIDVSDSGIVDIFPPIWFDLSTDVFDVENELDIETDKINGSTDTPTTYNTKIIGVY